MNWTSLQQLIRNGESQHLEFKSTPDLNAIGASVCALLNSEGGAMFIGVTENGEINPMSDANQLREEISVQLREHLTPAALWSVSPETTPQGEIISIEVPAGQDGPYVWRNQIYARRENQSQPATAEIIRALVQSRAAQPTRWERLPATGLALEDLDDREIELTARQVRGTSNSLRLPEREQLLEEWSLLQFGVLTNAADVLFARNPALRLPQSRIRVTLFESDKGGNYIDNRVLEGHAFQLLEDVFSFVRQHIAVESRFEENNVQRQDRSQYPFFALREGIINALIHRDYSSFTGGMSVGVYPGRIEIWNSGQLPEGLKAQDLKKEHPSLPSNPDMAHIFYLRGFIERLGRGTQKIVQECRDAGLPAPEWKISRFGITLIFYSRKTSPTKPLNTRQKSLLRSLARGEELPPARYYEQTQNVVGQRQAQRDLTNLEQGGWLQREGDGPATTYIRTAKEWNE